MTEEAAAERLERYRDTWRKTPGVADLGAQLPDPARMERLWGSSDFLAQACLRDPALLARLHTSGLLGCADREHEMQAALAAALAGPALLRRGYEVLELDTGRERLLRSREIDENRVAVRAPLALARS